MQFAPKSRLLSCQPDNPRAYVHQTPVWLLKAFRVMLLAAAIALAVLSARTWTDMPRPAQVLVSILSPAFLMLSLWSRPWKSAVKFMADDQGLYFPGNSHLVMSLTAQTNTEWLFVPWLRIQNLRLSTETGDEGGPCVAFDVTVSPTEREAFFKHVGTPRDRRAPNHEVVFAAYGDLPPHPKKTLSRLNALRSQSES